MNERRINEYKGWILNWSLCVRAMNCPQNLELYVLDALSREERAAVEAHVHACAACRSELAQLQALAGYLRKPVPGGLRRRLQREVWLARLREHGWRRQPVWLRVAAMLAVVCGLSSAALSGWGFLRELAAEGNSWTQAGICAVPAANGNYPAVSGSIVVAVEKKGDHQVLLAMDRNIGLRLWESPFAVGGCPAVDEDRVYVWRATTAGRFDLAAVEVGVCRKMWTASEGAAVTCRRPWPTVAACHGVAWCDDCCVTMLDGATGSARWTHSISDEGVMAVPVAGSNRLLVASTRSIQALDAADGHVLWRTADDDASAGWQSTPPLAQCEGNLLVVVRTTHAGRGLVQCCDAATGALRWSRETEMPWHLAVAGGRVFLRGAHIQAWDGETGHTAWSVPMGGCSPIEVDHGRVYTVEGANRKGIYAWRADTGKLVWTQRMLSSCSGFSVAGRMGYLSTQDGLLRAVVIGRRGSWQAREGS